MNINNLILQELPTRQKNVVCLFVFEELSEISHPTFGGSRLIYELSNQIRKQNDLKMISLHEINSLTSIFLKIRKNGKKENHSLLFSNERVRWGLAVFMSLFGEILSYIDVSFIMKCDKMIEKMNPHVLFYNGTIGARAVWKLCKKKNICFFICEHNVDYYFLNEKVNSRLFTPIIMFYRSIEITALRKANIVLFFNKNDIERVRGKVDSTKFRIVSFPENSTEPAKEIMHGVLPQTIAHKIGNKVIVCYLGAKYTPNIISVKQIIKMAQKIPNAIFLIVGSVGEVFMQYESPENVIFTGYVENLGPFLASADIFLNLKFTSETGIEAKMFDYIKFNKPIISTIIGIHGFESNPNVIVVKNASDAVSKIRQIVKEREKDKFTAQQKTQLDG